MLNKCNISNPDSLQTIILVKQTLIQTLIANFLLTNLLCLTNKEGVILQRRQ